MRLPDQLPDLDRVPGWAWAVLGFGAVYLWMRRPSAAGVGQAVGSTAVAVVDGVVSGTVKGVGGVFGLPDTNQAQCEAAKASNDRGAASVYCTAGEFVKWMLTPAKPAKPAGNVTVKPAGQASPAVGGVHLDGSIDTSGVTGWGGSFEDLSAPILPITTQKWIQEKNTPTIIPVAGLRG